jgi:hypothetical protein
MENVISTVTTTVPIFQFFSLLNRDVVGKAKGQGQEKEVVRNRHKKTVTKSQHKKSGADFKRSRGMFPT